MGPLQQSLQITMLSAPFSSLGATVAFGPVQPRSWRSFAIRADIPGERIAIPAASPSGKRSQAVSTADEEVWVRGAFPAYLQSEVDDFCAAWSDSVQEHDSEAARQQGKTLDLVSKSNPVWQAIRHQASQEAAEEMLLSSFYHASILGHDSFAKSLAFVLANRLADATLLATELFEIFHQILKRDEKIKQAALLDIVAFYERDPACATYSGALLYFKGYHAIQTHRIAHVLWTEGRKVLALALQARISEVLAIDIHPGAVLGKGLLIDHGTGVVIGETCRIGDNVSIMQNVTLGGTGKTAGNRHPQVANNVLIGAGASVLGNITIETGAQIAAGSLVLQDVPRRAMVAGSPAHVIGKVSGNAAMSMQQVLIDRRLVSLDQAQQQQQHHAVSSDGEPLASHQKNSNSDNGAASAASTDSNGNGSGPGGDDKIGAALIGGDSSNGDCSGPAAAIQTGSTDIGSLSDWALSAASKPRRSSTGPPSSTSSTTYTSSISSDSSTSSPSPPSPPSPPDLNGSHRAEHTVSEAVDGRDELKSSGQTSASFASGILPTQLKSASASRPSVSDQPKHVKYISGVESPSTHTSFPRSAQRSAPSSDYVATSHDIVSQQPLQTWAAPQQGPPLATLDRMVDIPEVRQSAEVRQLNSAWQLRQPQESQLEDQITNQHAESEIDEIDDCTVNLAPSGCEPDWVDASSLLQLLHRQNAAGSTDHNSGATLQDEPDQSSSSSAAKDDSTADTTSPSSAQAAALKRHNNRVLAEAGVMTGAAPWAVLSPFDVAAISHAAADAERGETQLRNNNRKDAAWAKPAAAVAAAHIMNPSS